MNSDNVDLTSFFVVVDRSVELMIKHVIGTAKECGVRLVKDLKVLGVEDLIKLDEMILSVKMRVDANVKLAKTYIKKANGPTKKGDDDDLVKVRTRKQKEPVVEKSVVEGTVAYYRTQGASKLKAKAMAKAYREKKIVENSAESLKSVVGRIEEAVFGEVEAVVDAEVEVVETEVKAEVTAETVEAETEVAAKVETEVEAEDHKMLLEIFEVQQLDEAIKSKDRVLDDIHHDESLTDSEKADRRREVFDELFELRKKKRLREAKKLVTDVRARAAGGVLELEKTEFEKYQSARTFVEDGNEVVYLGAKPYQRESVIGQIQTTIVDGFFADAAVMHTSKSLDEIGTPSTALRLPDGRMKAVTQAGLKSQLMNELFADLIRDVAVDTCIKERKALNEG